MQRIAEIAGYEYTVIGLLFLFMLVYYNRFRKYRIDIYLAVCFLLAFLTGWSKIFIILPMGILIGFAIAAVTEQLNRKNMLPAALLCLFIMLLINSRFIYGNDFYYKADNKEKIYDTAVEICSVVNGEKEPFVAIHETQGIFIRQYNPEIRLLYGPEFGREWDNANEDVEYIRNAMKESEPDMKSLSEAVKRLECDYLVLISNQVEHDNPENYGFLLEGHAEQFYVYKNMRGE